jgi:uncharacterized protein (TIGR03084 family)
MKKICDDLAAEQDSLDLVISQIKESDWDLPTPAEGWTIRDQISHLAFYDNKAVLAIQYQDAFNKHVKEIFNDPKSFIGADINKGRAMAVKDIINWWRKERTSLLRALIVLDPRTRIPWYGPSMSAKSHATARLMETWAHGQDVVDALRVDRKPSDRILHIAHLGYQTFNWSFINHGLETPEKQVRLELKSPSGETWTWGPADAENMIRGSAYGFCLVVIQRRNYLDTDLEATGDVAVKWMSIAQCFAGPPTIGPKQGSRV